MVLRQPHAVGQQSVGRGRLVIRRFQQGVVELGETGRLAPPEAVGVEGVEATEAEEASLAALWCVRIDVVEVTEGLVVLEVAVPRDSVGLRTVSASADPAVSTRTARMDTRRMADTPQDERDGSMARRHVPMKAIS